MNREKGFTLIELIIVLVLIGILAAVAIPRFANLQEGAQDASVQGTLGNVRSALTIVRAENMANSPGDDTVGGTVAAWWPSLTNIQTPGDVIEGPMPAIMKGGNPTSNTITGDVTGDGSTRPADETGGWRYNSENGHFWADTSEATQNGAGPAANML